jgi:hypothetical protein
MRLGLSSYTYTWAVGVPGHLPERPLSALDLVDRAAAAGLACVQIADNLPLDRLATVEANTLRTHAAARGVAVEVGARGLTPERLAAHVELAVSYASPILRFVIDGPGYEPTPDEVERGERTLREVAGDADRPRVGVARKAQAHGIPPRPRSRRGRA